MRASKRPLAVLCPSSALPAEHTIEVAKEAADVGTIAHNGIASRILQQEHIAGTTAEQCRIVGADLQEVEPLIDLAMGSWDHVYCDGAIRTRLMVETPYSHKGALGGTPDARWVQPGDPKSAWVLDWKFGRERRDCYHQLAQYAYDMRDELIAAGEWSDDMTITTIARWVRLGQEERRVFDTSEISAWWMHVTSREQECGKTYNPGDHCGFCPHSSTCQPRLNWSRSACESLAHTQETSLSEPALIGRIYDQAKAVRRALAAYDAALGSILDNGGSIPLPDGRVLRRELSARDSIDLRAAWGPMRDAGLTAADLAKVASISKTQLQRVIQADAPRGTKKAKWEAFLATLRDANAIGTKYVRKTIAVDGTNIDTDKQAEF